MIHREGFDPGPARDPAPREDLPSDVIFSVWLDGLEAHQVVHDRVAGMSDIERRMLKKALLRPPRIWVLPKPPTMKSPPEKETQ